jgi:spermidine synthase
MVEHRNTRHLFFRLAGIQSTMSLEDPTRLVSAYTRKMMAFLLLLPNPRHIVMVGLGGGSLAKFCYRNLPKTRLTIIEHNAEVIALRDHFCIPGDDERFRVIHDDGAHYMQRTREETDVVLVDAFDEAGIAPSLATADFYIHAEQCMQGHGVFVMNFSGERTRYVPNLQKIRATFDDRVLLVPVARDGNLLVFASKKIALHQRLKGGDRHARRLQERLALEFPRFLARLRKGHGFRVTAASEVSQEDILEEQARAEIIPGE